MNVMHQIMNNIPIIRIFCSELWYYNLYKEVYALVYGTTICRTNSMRSIMKPQFAERITFIGSCNYSL